MEPRQRWQLAPRIVLVAALVAAAAGLTVGIHQERGGSWTEMLDVGAGALVPADLMYRTADALGQSEWAESLTQIRWRLRETAVAEYEKLAYGAVMMGASAEARLRLAIAYGEGGYAREASEALASVPEQAPRLLRLALLLDWLYGRGHAPVDRGLSVADLSLLDPWLVRKCELRLAEKQGDEAARKALEEDRERTELAFLTLLLVEAAAWVGLLAVGAGVGCFWLLRWLFTRRPDYQVRRAPFVKPWRPMDAVEVWAALLVLVVAASLLASLLPAGDDQPLPGALLDAVGYLLASAGALAYMATKLSRQPLGLRTLLGLHGAPARGVVGGVVVYAVVGVGLLAAGALVAYLFSPAWLAAQSSGNDLVRQSFAEPAAAVIYGIIAILVAPVVEETLFRGFIYAGLRRRLGVGGAVIASSAMFAGTHVGFPVVAMIGVGMLAVAMALAYERTRDLWVSIGMHITHNALVFALMALTAV